MNACAVTGQSYKPIRLPITRWLLYLLILSFPFFSIEPKIFRPDWWVGGAFILVFVANMLVRGKFCLDSIGKAVIGLHITVLLSVAVNAWEWQASQWTEFFTLWVQLLFATLLYFALASLKLSVAQMKVLLKLLISVAVIVALYGLYQAVARNLDLPLAYLPYLHWVPTEHQLQVGLGYGGYIRPASFFREPTYLGEYLLAPLWITATLVFYRRDIIWLFRSHRLNIVLLICLLGGLLVSFALAAYVTLVTLFLISLLIDRSTRKTAFRATLVLILTLAAFIGVSKMLDIPFLQGLTTRVSWMVEALSREELTAADPSVATRYLEIILALSTWVHHPLFGVGLNQLQFKGAYYATGTFPSWIVETGYTHNIWLEVLVQLGAVGFFFYGLIWLRALRMLRAVFLKGREPIRWLGLSFMFVVLAMMIRGLMGGPFTLLLIWFYLGMASIVSRLARGERDARLG